ncbi:hypothetical protein [Mesobacillus zeae]|uniref:Phospholipase A2 domain-containing protein n=1 Tax=Mesobacillus zeae TaxID=1917180 RepID=A0A398AZE5_9BACI|nr:hypothetical protein [Mesobacillus zeae]RID82922.1 hypothetical protein D1970_17680 [Mesobacillus zeae]
MAEGLNLLKLDTHVGTDYKVTAAAENEKSLLAQAFAHFNKQYDIAAAPKESKTYVNDYVFDTEKGNIPVKQTNVFMKYGEDMIISFLKTENNEKRVSYLVKVTALVEEDGKLMKRIAVFMDGEVLAERELPTAEAQLEIPVYEELEPSESGEVNAEDIDDCWLNGCCSFRYNGLPWNPLVNYKWCGANCGSGTPVNPLDTCCRTHDYCYGSYSSYPARCSCDRTLIQCAGTTDNAGTDRVIAAFKAKMLAMGC